MSKSPIRLLQGCKQQALNQHNSDTPKVKPMRTPGFLMLGVAFIIMAALPAHAMIPLGSCWVRAGDGYWSSGGCPSVSNQSPTNPIVVGMCPFTVTISAYAILREGCDSGETTFAPGNCNVNTGGIAKKRLISDPTLEGYWQYLIYDIERPGAITITASADGNCCVGDPAQLKNVHWEISATVYVREDGTCSTGCSDPDHPPSFPDPQVDPQTAALNFKLALGLGDTTADAGALQIAALAPAAIISKPAGLKFPIPYSTVQTVETNGALRQIRAPQTLANVITNGDYEYYLDFYTPANFSGEINTNTGLFDITGTNFVRWTISNTNGAGSYHTLNLKETRPGAADRLFQYIYVPASNGWSLVQPDGLTTRSVWALQGTNSAITNFIERVTVGGQVLSQTILTYQYRSYLSDRVLIQKTEGIGAEALTTTYTYYPSNSVYGGNTNQLRRVDHPDGNWVYYEYDAWHRLKTESSAYGTNAAPAPDTVPTPATSRYRETRYYYTLTSAEDGMDFEANPVYYDDYSAWAKKVVRLPVWVSGSWTNVEVSRQYQFSHYLGDLVYSYLCPEPGAAVYDAGNHFSLSEYKDYPGLGRKLWYVSHADGSATLYKYDLEEAGLTTTVETGDPDYWLYPWYILNGTRTVTVTDGLGRTLCVTNYSLDQDREPIVLSVQNYGYHPGDPTGRNHSVTNLAGLVTTYLYACCGLESVTDPDGVITSYDYDTLKRVSAITTTRGANSITILQTWDGAGQLVQRQRVGSDSSFIPLEGMVYDTLGRTLRQTNALGGVTTTTNLVNNSGKVVTNTHPDLGTRVAAYAPDGNLLYETGTAAFPVSYFNGAEKDEEVWRQFNLTVKIANGGGTNEWVKTYQDGVGQVYKTVFPAGSGTVAAETIYDSQGEIIKQIDPDGVVTLFDHVLRGNASIQAADTNRDDVIDYAGPDRVTMTTNDVLTAHGYEVQRRSTYVFAGTDDTPTLLSTSETSTDGLRTWQTTYNNGQPLTRHSVTVYAANNYRYVTNLAPDNAYSVATYRYAKLLSVTTCDALNNQLSASSYGYDAHGRQNVITDARNGSSTNWFNNADQISSTKTPVPGAGQSAQVTTNLFDTSGRIWKTVLPDGGVVTNDFTLSGQAQTISGARTYPSGNGYDAQGRFKSLTNWSAFPATGTRATTWNYDPYRGWLTGKSYPDSTGPGYTYSDAGRLKTRLWARSVNTTNSYNAAGDLSNVNYNDSTPAVGMGFDRRGRTTSVTNGATVITSTLNDVGLLLSDSSAGGVLNGLSVTNGYDALLRRTNLTLNTPLSSFNTTYGYDSVSRLSTVRAGTNSATYSYVANSPLVSHVLYTNGSTLRMARTNQYDNLNRLTNLVWKSGSTTVASFAYQYNNANQRTRATLADGSYWLYLYDPLGQVTSSKKYWSDGTPVAGQQATYDFDDIGNRKAAAFGGDQTGANLRSATYGANLLNQYTNRTVPGYVNILGSATNTATVSLWSKESTALYTPTSRKGEYFRGEIPVNNATGAVWLTITNIAVLQNGSNPDIVTNRIGKLFVPKTAEAFSYDLDGNLTNDGRWSYTWDAENRVTSFTRNNAAPSGSKVKLDCQYDSRSRRNQKIISAWNGSAYVAQSTNKFVYDDWNLIAVLDATNGLVQSFTWGTDASGTLQGAGGVGGLISMTVHQGTNAGSYFYCYDGNHNVATLVNATNGAIAAQYEYDALGNPLRATGVLAFVNPFSFSTKFCDWETGMLYYGYRYYDSKIGRWLSRDPIGERGGNNLYAIADNDLIDHVDSLGQTFRWATPWIYTLSQPRGTTFGATAWWDGGIIPVVPLSGIDCPLGFYKLIINGRAKVVSWSVVNDQEARDHEDVHVYQHFKPAADSFAQTAESRAGVCMCLAKANCVRSVIMGPMVRAYKLQALAVAKEFDCAEYGHHPADGGRTCAQAATLARDYVAALEALDKAMKACD